MAEGIRAGALYWDLDVKQADQAKAKVREIGKELDKALNTGRDRASGVTRLAKEATDASKNVKHLAEQFTLLNSRYKLGQVDSTEYASRLEKLGKGLKWAGDQAGLSSKDYSALASVTTKVAAEQDKLAAAQEKGAISAGKQVTAATGITRAMYEAARAQAAAASTQENASARVGRLADQFTKLQGQFRAGTLTTSQYTSRLAQLEQGITRTTRQTGLSASEWGKLGNTMRQVQTAQATLGGSTAQVNARVQVLVKETSVLRNEWQRTGQATDATKNRLNALQLEMAELAAELRKADGGWERFNRQIAQLGTAGRSAEATIAGMEGRMSRLGLASQVNLATQQADRKSVV